MHGNGHAPFLEAWPWSNPGLGTRLLEVKPVLNENKKNRSALSNLNINPERLEEIEGTIKWYNPAKKFGFVFPDNGGIDIFFHTAILHAQDTNLLSQEPAS